MYSSLVFVAISVAVAFLHMIAPDHWLPLTALSLKRRYRKRRVLEISALLGLLHGFTSVLLSVLALFVGVSIFGLSALKEVSIIILIAVAAYMSLNLIRERKGSSEVENTSLLVSILPDPVLLPIVIAAYSIGKTELTIIFIAFVATSVISLLLVLGVVMTGVVKGLSRLKPMTVDMLVIAALFISAIYIFFFG